MAQAPQALVGITPLWGSALRAAAVASRPRGLWSCRFGSEPRFVPRLVSTDASSASVAEAIEATDSTGRKADGVLPFGFGFSAGGLLFPYLVGVAYGLQDAGLLREDTKLAGASAGSLVAGCLHSGLTAEEVMEGCFRVAMDCRVNGTRGRLKAVLLEVLGGMLPEDCHLRCSGKTYVAITEVYPNFGGKLLSEYHSRSDFIDALMTSCHIPWWFDNTVVTDFRSGVCTDGGLTNLIPSPPDSRPVRICCFPASGLNVDIAPDMFRECKYSFAQMISWAFEPPELDETLWELMEMGRSDANSFKQSQPSRLALDSEPDNSRVFTMMSRLQTMFRPKD